MKNINENNLTKMEKVNAIYALTYFLNYCEYERLTIDETLEEWELNRILKSKCYKAIKCYSIPRIINSLFTKDDKEVAYKALTLYKNYLI